MAKKIKINSEKIEKAVKDILLAVGEDATAEANSLIWSDDVEVRFAINVS